MEGFETYHELAVGSVSNRGIIVPASQVPSYIKDGKQELYRSYFQYGPEILEHMKVLKSVRTYRGHYHISAIIFDIDKGPNTDQATLDTVKAFVDRLKKEFVSGDGIWVYFSGRGYHVQVPDFFGFTPSPDLPRIVKTTLSHYFPTVDQIYDGGRIIRVPHTINMKSGLYKIPLTMDELFSVTAEQVKALAVTQRLDCPKPARNSLPQNPELIIQPSEPRTTVRGLPIAKPDQMSNIVSCVQNMYTDCSLDHRHEKSQAIASAWRRAGVPKDAIMAALTPRFPTMEPYELERTVNDVFDRDRKYSCHSKMLADYCDPKCIHYAKKNYAAAVMDATELEERLAVFSRMDWSGKVIDLKDIYPGMATSFRLMPGEYITLMGDTGLGKTAWVQNLLVHLKEMPSVLLSLENSDLLMYRRFVQIAHGMSKEQVFAYYKNNDNHLSEELAHIKVMTTSPDLQQIRQVIAQHQPRILVVDTIDCIQVRGVPDFERMKIIPTELHNMAVQYDIIIIGVSHVSKKASSVGALDVHSPSGPATIEQRSDVVLGIEGSRTTAYRTLSSLKGRDESPFRLSMMYDTNTFRMQEVQL